MGKYIIGSNVSMSYLPERNVVMDFFHSWMKRQSNTLEEQYELGVRAFEFKIRFDGNWFPVFSNGIFEYDENVMITISSLLRRATNDKERVFVKYSYDGEMDQVIKRKFISLIEDINDECPMLGYSICDREGTILHSSLWPKSVNIGKVFKDAVHRLLPVREWKWEQDKLFRCISKIAPEKDIIIFMDFV